MTREGHPFEMNQEEDFDSDQTQDPWLSRFENECYGELEAQSGVDSRVDLPSIEERSAQQLWLGFQQTSTALAQLYNLKESSNDGYVVLVPFNKAAESLTKFYKDSVNNARECLRLGVQSGRTSRARDIAAWARKKRKSIRRDELLAYLCGKTLPPHLRNRQNRSLERQIPRFSSHQTDNFETGDYPVRDAFSLQGRTGTMANFNMGLGRSSTTSSSTMNSRTEELRYHDERVRGDHRKRANSSSSMDVSMDLSPSRKRGRFL